MADRRTQSLVVRVREQIACEALRDVEALYRFIDPEIRRRREQARDDEPELTRTALRDFVSTVVSAEVREIEILEARKVCRHYGGRPAALVRSVVHYNEGPAASEFRSTWVRDRSIWYTTELRGTGAAQP